MDGNKRLGWLATVVLLDLDGAAPASSDDQAFELVMDVARGAADLEEIAERLHMERASGVGTVPE